MPKIFSRVRKELLNQNEIKKYSKYAFGEIILVVLGILIAISINTCNENKKSARQEHKLLTQVKKDVISNQSQLDSLILGLEVNLSFIDTLLIDLKKEEYSQRIAICTGYIHKKAFFINSNSGYTLISSGFAPIIQNSDLLNHLLDLYEIHFNDVLIVQNSMHDHIENRLYPKTNSLFKVLDQMNINLNDGLDNQLELYKPIDYQALRNNQEYINTIHQLRTKYKNRLSHSKKTKGKIVDFLRKLEAELK